MNYMSKGCPNVLMVGPQYRNHRGGIGAVIATYALGYGSEKGKDLMFKSIGIRLFTHNGFIEILQWSGLIGLSIFFLYFLVKQQQYSRFCSTSIGIFIGWIFVGLFQEFAFIYLNVFLSAFLALQVLSKKREPLLNSRSDIIIKEFLVEGNIECKIKFVY